MDDSVARLYGREQTTGFLAGAHNQRKETAKLEKESLNYDCTSGTLTKSTDDSAISNYSERVLFPTQASAIVNNPSYQEGLAYLRQKVDAVQHPKGATYTEGYGNVHTHGGAGAAKQRGRNTYLCNVASLHHLDIDKVDAVDVVVDGLDPLHVNQAV